MNIEKKKNVFKVTGFLFLAILFSTNYYGGNSLFFLEDEILFVLRVFFGVAGCFLLIMYLAISNKEKRELVEYNGHFYTSEVMKQMENNQLSKDDIELVLEKGLKKKGRASVFYTCDTQDGRQLTVALNNKGYIVDITI